ncbi:hypothetical protein BST81_20760 [Leptolyngbya sp. 'hensonii']|uniref:diguanylate cyclase n=1 Tax=Leptolyngbya sp. 'hensonii' TaxID=1922337 RepID=UPI00094FAE05|nr:diguanylate cyclase [Leptolyngbya sp. 'hensonii']OLP16419.1 hypothetical protein BST81_20760 [Leptolyngbya sp. 'hensonii']
MLHISNLPLGLTSILEDLPLHNIQVELDCSGSKVIKIFEKNPFLPGIVLVEQGEFRGMVSRRQFFESMSRPYSLDLFSKRPIRTLYEFTPSDALTFPGEMSIVNATRQVLSRPQTDLYEPIIVLTRQGVYKILDAQKLLLAQSQIHLLTISALEESQEALSQEKELAQVTLQSIGDAVITTDAQGRIESLNPMAEKLTGWTAAAAYHQPLTDVFCVIDEVSRQPVANPVTTLLQHGLALEQAEHKVLIAREGHEVAIDDSAAPIYSRTGLPIGAVLVFRDVTRSRRMAHQLSWQATHDALTGLVNRHEFERCLEQATDLARLEERRHTLCYMDLDHFKIINDTCGHHAGDELLRQVTHLLQTEIRKTDTLARLGGDEFGLLLYECSVAEGLQVAENLCHRVKDYSFFFEDHTFHIGVSIGLVEIQPDYCNPSHVLRAADTACYVAKRGGRNCVQVFQQTQMGKVDHASIGSAILESAR